MRILHIVPHYFPALEFGGPPLVVFNLASEMARTEDVTVYTTDVLDKKRRLKIHLPKLLNKVKVFYFPNLSHNLAANHNLYLPLKMYYFLWKNINRFDIVHIHEYYTLAHILVSGLIKNHKPKLVLSGHGTLRPLTAAGRMFRKNIYHALFTSRIFPKVGMFIANSHHEYLDYRKLGIPGRKIRLIPNGLNLKQYRTDGSTLLRISRLNNMHKPRVLFLGRIQQKKGIELLIEAIKPLKLDLPKISCVIAGPVEDREYYWKLKRLVKDFQLKGQVEFTGMVTGNKKLALLAGADFLVLPSYGEGLATVILEAAATKIPVIATKYAGASEFIRERAIQACQPESYDIARKIRRLWADKKSRREQVTRAYELVKKNYSIERVSGETLQMFNELLKK